MTGPGTVRLGGDFDSIDKTGKALTNMRSTHIQDILPLVEAPSRYLGSEVNTVHKDHRQVNLKFALAFPDLYEIGTSHFGLQILYHILNKRPDVVAERVFTPAPDMQTCRLVADPLEVIAC